MIHFDLPKQKSSIIKVIGVGGGGSNAVNFMYDHNIAGVDFIICNTDAKALEQSNVPNKIQLGPFLTQGLGAGANPEVGKHATEESIEEIKKILEVNTKMAFVTAGMGGGTGTGGAPIIAKICKELGILTVGIVTTPFSFEGPRRQKQAEAGINELKPYVDTLLIISNDKLRVQFGNLKMREAFGKADNVLGTAAKCITDIINSTGHVIVDFADVCTVMKNGGVAILGSAEVQGEDRAQRAIEEALNSPLLDDNDIHGAKWILININSASGDFESTMDEIDVISSHIRMQAGEDTDVIVGMGYDNSLGEKIGITLIATGFKHKDPFLKKDLETISAPVKAKAPEKEMHVLAMNEYSDEVPIITPQKEAAVVESIQEDVLAPSLTITDAKLKIVNSIPVQSNEVVNHFLHEQSTNNLQEVNKQAFNTSEQKNVAETASSYQAASFSFAKPTNIYNGDTAAPVPQNNDETTKQADDEMALVFREESVPMATSGNEESIIINEEAEEQKRKAKERLKRLRNLSYDGTGDNDFENVPAYVRKNMELYGANTMASSESYYSRVTVKKDENGGAELSNINSFLDGKKPD